MNTRLLGTIIRIIVLVLIGASFVALMYYFEIRASKTAQDFTMFYFFVVPLTAGLCAIMSLLQIHYYRHPERDEHE